MTSSFIEQLSREEWEPFCEVMLRQHHGAKYFWPVPDEDGGDLGLEFFTADGTVYQCYRPNDGLDMAKYKKSVQKKIREDLAKLEKNEEKIAELLDNIKISHWVLLTPHNRSKDLIKYCQTKKNEVIKRNLTIIDNDNFTVKIETADSFPQAKRYAQGVCSTSINIPLMSVTDAQIEMWKSGNVQFVDNIKRKSETIMGPASDRFKKKVVTKYMQVEKFLDQLRDEHPDLYNMIEDSARAQLDKMETTSVLAEDIDSVFIREIIESNEGAFKKHTSLMSDSNVQTLSFGYLSKWLAECYMDFEDGS